jgi:hypothetical protein
MCTWSLKSILDDGYEIMKSARIIDYKLWNNSNDESYSYVKNDRSEKNLIRRSNDFSSWFIQLHKKNGFPEQIQKASFEKLVTYIFNC